MGMDTSPNFRYGSPGEPACNMGSDNRSYKRRSGIYNNPILGRTRLDSSLDIGSANPTCMGIAAALL